MESFEDYKCILCYKLPSKKNDINILDGKETIQTELDDLPFVVLSSAKCICKTCLSLINKRRGLKERLADIDKDLTMAYRTALSANGIPVKMKRKAANKLIYEIPPDNVPSSGFGCLGKTHESSNRLVLVQKMERLTYSSTDFRVTYKHTLV